VKKQSTNQQLEILGDEQLVALFQARGGSAAAAYGTLIHRHHPDLLRRCRARLGNIDDAEEAVQETLVRAFRGLLRFRGEAAFRTWLYSISDNQCNTLYLRRSRLAMSEHVRALIALHEEMSHSGPEAEDHEAIERVREVLSGLPSQARDVLMLRFYRDLSLEYIARSLGIGLSAAKMRLYRALAQFEVAFETSGGAEVA
jgi:RNA polymerase sigma-70 factor (ECF subfamily)